MAQIDQLLTPSFTKAGREGVRTVTFLPEPERRARKYTIISVDDHIVEPAHTFTRYAAERYRDLVPTIVEDEDGNQHWRYNGTTNPNIGLSAAKGRPVEEYSLEASRFDHMRPGAYDPDARVADMDINGVYASVNFPSSVAGFCGHRLQMGVADADLALEAVRAHNRWHLEEWAQAHPDRFIPAQLPWLRDVEVAAAEIRRNADAGFKAVHFTEAPQKFGLPSLHTGYWDPFLAACEDTQTVINLHIGSSGTAPTTADDAPADTVGVLFFGFAMFTAVDWLFSQVPLRFPDIRIVISEGGIGWVAGLLDRLDHMEGYRDMYGTWGRDEIRPAEVLQRNFWFCAVEDPTAFRTVDRIGVDNVLLEADYPHVDSTWPDTQEVVDREVRDLPADAIRKITWENASLLYRHPVPAAVQEDPDAY
ncbi:MAG TPA: amidohydrolase family protein [Acidimicrobiales bacterium]|nr:amidohydrolase family protein [Acidimicrobiales bacterium]